MPAVIPYRPPCSDSFEFFSENDPQHRLSLHSLLWPKDLYHTAFDE